MGTGRGMVKNTWGLPLSPLSHPLWPVTSGTKFWFHQASYRGVTYEKFSSFCQGFRWKWKNRHTRCDISTQPIHQAPSFCGMSMTFHWFSKGLWHMTDKLNEMVQYIYPMSLSGAILHGAGFLNVQMSVALPNHIFFAMIGYIKIFGWFSRAQTVHG